MTQKVVLDRLTRIAREWQDLEVAEPTIPAESIGFLMYDLLSALDIASSELQQILGPWFSEIQKAVGDSK